MRELTDSERNQVSGGNWIDDDASGCLPSAGGDLFGPSIALEGLSGGGGVSQGCTPYNPSEGTAPTTLQTCNGKLQLTPAAQTAANAGYGINWLGVAYDLAVISAAAVSGVSGSFANVVGGAVAAGLAANGKPSNH